MGYYINRDGDGNALNAKGKADQLIKSGWAKEITSDDFTLNDFEENLAVLCVVENYHFDAIGFAFDENELKIFKHDDGRNKRWLLMDKKAAIYLSGYEK
jgi:hypothetical protein